MWFQKSFRKGFQRRFIGKLASLRAGFLFATSLLGASIVWGRAPSSSVVFEKGEIPIVSQYEKGALLSLCESQLTRFDASLKSIESLKPRERSVQKTILAYERASADLSRRLGPILALSKLSPVEFIRQESLACEEKHTKLMSEVPFRRALYLSFLGFQPQEPEARRLWKETVRGFEANGATLVGAARERAQKLQEKLALLENQYRNNVAQYNEKLRFSATDLKGVDLQPLSAFLQKEGHYDVPVKASYLRPLIENAEAWQTRQRAVEAIWNLAQTSNVPLLKQATEIRKELAGLYGQKSWFDHRTASKMAKSEKNVRNFLRSLRKQLKEALEGDLQQIRAAKKEHLKGTPLENEELQIWDPPFYAEKLRQKIYNLDQNELKKFFPSEQVIAGVFQIYSRIFSVTFEELPQAEVWSPEVKVYRVRDAQDKSSLGLLYMDLHPREFKYNHAALFGVIDHQTRSSDSANLATGIIVANMPKAQGSQPGLMTYDDVETYFHEFGHAMHHLLTRAPYASLAGANVKWDFVEAPSQMLENWMKELQPLQIVSRHIQTGKTLDQAWLDRIRASDRFFKGYFYSRQMALAEFDLRLHQKNPTRNIEGLMAEITREFQGIAVPGSYSFAGNFGHMMGGYDAGYYGYLWSKVYAQDMWTLFQSAPEGAMDVGVGLRYRREILEKGNLEEPEKLLEKFLGRKPNNKAFFAYFGLKTLH